MKKTRVRRLLTVLTLVLMVPVCLFSVEYFDCEVPQGTEFKDIYWWDGECGEEKTGCDCSPVAGDNIMHHMYWDTGIEEWAIQSTSGITNQQGYDACCGTI